jgi:hypothetical protein
MNNLTKKVTAVLAMILAISYGLSLAAAGVSVPGASGCAGP